jgi:hypothetical protein
MSTSWTIAFANEARAMNTALDALGNTQRFSEPLRPALGFRISVPYGRGGSIVGSTFQGRAFQPRMEQ